MVTFGKLFENKEMKAKSALLALLPAILFCVGLIWVLLFPAVSISSGELKPRGIYVDEHSLLVQSNIVGFPKLQHLHGCIQEPQLCTSLNLANVHCSYFGNADSPRIIQIEVLPWHVVNSFDTTVLVFQFSSKADCTYQASLSLAYSVATELGKARWNARKVLILLVPAGDDTTQSTLLQSWIQQHHNPTVEEIIQAEMASLYNIGGSGGSSGSSSVGIGNIREVYIFDLTAEAVCSHTDAATYTGTPLRPSNSIALLSTEHKDRTDTTLRFETATLHYTGHYGALPNMDLIAYPLAKFPKVLVTESQQCAVALHKTIESVYSYYARTEADDVVSALLKPVVAWLQSVDVTLLPPAYRQRLLGLLCSMHALVTTEHSLHGYFANYNIDAITIKPTKLSEVNQRTTLKNGDKPNKKRTSTHKKNTKTSMYGGDTLLHMAMSFVYISNNLQEELHHSHFYYLIMGSGHFTGITEYGFTAALFLLSVLCLLVHVSSKCSMEGIKHAVCSVTLCVLPLLVWLVAVMPILMQESIRHAPNQCVSPMGMWHSIDTATEVQTLITYVSCHFHTACAVLQDYIPIDKVDRLSRTLCILACITSLVTGLYKMNSTVRSTNFTSSIVSATEVNAVDEKVLIDEGSSDKEISKVTMENSGKKCDIVDNPTLSDGSEVVVVSTLDVHMWSVCLLCFLVILAHTFAHNFSLGLFLTCLYLPSAILLTYLQSCNVKTMRTVFGCVVLLLAMVVYSGAMILFLMHWFAAHTYVYKLILLLTCVVCVGVCSYLGTLIQVLRK